MMRLDASISAASNACVVRSQQRAFKAGRGQTKLVKSQAAFNGGTTAFPPAHLTRISSWSLTVDWLASRYTAPGQGSLHGTSAAAGLSIVSSAP